MSGLRSVLAICGGKVNDDWSGRSAMMEWLYRWEMLLEEIEDNLEDFVMPDVIPPQVECCRTVAQHMEQRLSLTAQFALTRMTFPHGKVRVVWQCTLASIESKFELE